MTRPPHTPEMEDLLGVTPEDRAADAKAFELVAERAKLRTAELKRLMGQEWFRTWMWDTLTACNTFEIIHAASPTGFPDPRATDYFLGRRSVGWDLWCLLDNLAPDHASLMRREAKDKA